RPRYTTGGTSGEVAVARTGSGPRPRLRCGTQHPLPSQTRLGGRRDRLIDRAIDMARSRAVGAAAPSRFLQGDVTRLADLDIGDDYGPIIDSGCYKSLSDKQRDA